MAINLGISYTTKEKQEFEHTTLEKLKEGYSLSEIGDMIGISRWTVKEIKDKLVSDKKITEEEIEQAKAEREKMRRRPIKNRVLMGLVEGKNKVEISQDVSLTDVMVGKIVKELIEEGEITEEEIERKREERERKEAEKLEDEILAFLEQGYSYREIAPKTGLAHKTITKVKNKLIEDGKITEESIKQAQKERKRKMRLGEIKKEDEEKTTEEELTEELKQMVLELLKKGYKPISIPIKLKIERTLFYQIRDKLMIDGEITEEQIKEAQIEKGKKDRVIILRLLRQGYTQREICERIDEGKMYVQNRVNQFKREGTITDEDIERWQFENNEKDAKEAVLRGLRQGLTLEEIANSDETEFLTRDKVKRYKAELIDEGAITEREIKNVRKKTDKVRKRDRKKNRVDVYDARILKLLELGFPQKQIEKALDLSYRYVRYRKETLILRKEITQYKIKKAQQSREQVALERRTNIAEKIREAEEIKESDLEEMKIHIEYARAMVKLRKIQQEDIEVLYSAIVVAPELMTLANINVIIRGYIKTNNPNAALRFINECVSECANDKKILEKLEKAREEIKTYIGQQKALKMFEKGANSIEDVARETGILTVDAIRIKKEYEEKMAKKMRGKVGNSKPKQEVQDNLKSKKKQAPEGVGDDGNR